MIALTNLEETITIEVTSTATQFDVYKKCGWSEEEILDAFKNHPSIMVASEGRIETLMDFFVNVMGFKASYIAKQFYFPGLSMEKRLVSREKGTVGEREIR
ncbi:hypothetical protein Gohar_013491 [Gossypium harknessii]|uniref:Uncharacterized protein n=1 Tax=Gossypium harknessii TaxID=34285 RepID=A0A7J9H1L9_9ROSI|nr:hypothetical protein [Gossypium harknessii]